LTTDVLSAVASVDSSGRRLKGRPRRFYAAHVLWLGLLALPLRAAAAEPVLRVLDVPFVSQSEDLCGGAAAAMVLRFWGVRGVDAESFTHLVDHRAGGIRTTDLIRELDGRGWAAVAVPGSEARLADEINRNGRPVVALIEERPGAYHYVVVVGAPERGFIFHDPARSSYRVLARREFLARWRPASMWMALVAPRQAASPEPLPVTTVADARPVPETTRCDALVADGVRLAGAGDYAGSERTLTSALSCPGGAAYRELAGLRAVQKRWSDAASLAETAVGLTPPTRMRGGCSPPPVSCRTTAPARSLPSIAPASPRSTPSRSSGSVARARRWSSISWTSSAAKCSPAESSTARGGASTTCPPFAAARSSSSR
jgi:predicted double-glycine peptidase